VARADPRRWLCSLRLALAGLGAACAPAPPAEPPRPVPATEPPPAPAPEPETVELAVPGFRPAVVIAPGGSGPYPVLVAAHGAGDRAEWQCEWWLPVLGRRGFVLCPRGRAMSNAPGADTGYYFEDHHRLEREVLAAIRELRETFGARVDPGPALYAGYSQGAIMGALFTSRRGAEFSRLILIEGGYEEWNVPAARRFKQAGGERVLFACGHAYCAREADKAIGWLRRGGIAGRLEHVPGGGHTYAGEVGERVAAALGWLLEGDARW
jgi:predicted esterase